MSGLTLPIALEDLPSETKSWIITQSASRGIDPRRLAHDLLVSAAEADGFAPGPMLASSPSKPAERAPKKGDAQ
ncbi:hypothetical protein JIN84_18045 [Luteolibacter yonseiensis]|uniref:Uncharacterized protein n=1 Tax=Luteolibacter yonseiensis TaxID=1144680 RepID=A0A934R7U2_9BACT|nr:hypothetical protein [Luteolibacter yonseiensis]MBK1817528.1 hypothetical protein [Luteolibacter yonseiensis]